MIPGFRLIRRLVFLVVIVGGLFVAGNLYVKAQAEKRIEVAIEKEFKISGVQVEIDDFPVLVHIFSGELAAVSISADDIKIQGLRFRSLRVRLDGLRITGGILGGGNLEVNVKHGTLNAQATEAAINAYLKARGQNATVELHEDRAVLRAIRTVAGKKRRLVATGGLVLAPKSQVVRFVPERVTVDGNAPPPALAAEAKRQATIAVKIPKLPGGVKADSVREQEGTLRVSAEFDDTQLKLAA